MPSEHFDPITTDCRQGINLIEASAGTGKTYAIAMLALRFVVEFDMKIDELLVVTFTKAATEELKERIRLRLNEAKQAASGKTENIDGAIIKWLNRLEIDRDRIKKRLELALLDIDQAAVFTIHGFCQRVLKEHALESGQLFDSELTVDAAAVKQACADDFWRGQIYQRASWEAALLTAANSTPDALLAGIDRIPLDIEIFPEYRDPNEALAACREQAEQARIHLEQAAQTLLNHFGDGFFKSSCTEIFEHHLQELRAWLNQETLQPPSPEAFACLTVTGLVDGLNGNKFRKTKTQTGEQRKHEYLATLKIDSTPFDALSDSIDQISLVFRRALLEHVRIELDKQMKQLNILSFDDLISRLALALQGNQGALLTAELRQRFKAALIDEFQDTDQNQWLIFSTLFGSDAHYLYLIGDPKQAIYKFRGADIFSYLAAQQQAHHRFTLGTNWRSQPTLVEAVNALFSRERAFFLEQLQFQPVVGAPANADKTLSLDKKTLAPMVLWQLPQSDKGHWSSGKAGECLQAEVVNEIVGLLNEPYFLSDSGRRVLPGDIAVLVRTNRQASEYQAALREAGVPSVLNSTESVFATAEAADFFCLLQAIAHPGDTALLKQALTLDWFGLDGQTLYCMLNQEAALDAWLSHFLNYYQHWQNQGLMAMMQRLLDQEQIRLQLSASRLAERRLTNLHHLIELVQQAAVDEHLGIGKTLDWLRARITDTAGGKVSLEEQCMRLESDDEAVKIVTMHRSKGLEYNIVFCPSLWQRSSRLSTGRPLIQCHEQGRIVADLGSEDFERRRAQAIDEELAEDLRVCYVALTRAKYRSYLAWADVRSKDVPNQSALAWLLGFEDCDFAAQQSILIDYCSRAPNAFEYRLLELPAMSKGRYEKWLDETRLSARSRLRSLRTDWQMSSYTALSALSLQDAPELPEDKARELVSLDAEPALSAAGMQEDLPKGAHTGNVVHDLLERLDFAYLADMPNIAELRDSTCRRYGLQTEHPEAIDNLLQAVVTTPLAEDDPAFLLMNIADELCLKEMPFYLAMQSMNAAQINAILSDSPVYQALNSKQMCGYLTGFIDLICEYGGRYYVIDYKTNSLLDYRSEALTDAMREHNYGLQYWLYTLVLHRYLGQRLADYDYEKHFGGALYLFVRGMQPEQPMNGVYRDRPDLRRIEALSEIFDGAEALAPKL
ncbi:exodeoxyribonuclease V subunit beta [Methylotuvimicrobium sp. KM1]|uniref:exodeoxyribonuclease V subunit beta n=1 Tax=Methylotuvimicrobium sp. KM1 TaxID=3377707 RepID=UPI00384E1350